MKDQWLLECTACGWQLDITSAKEPPEPLCQKCGEIHGLRTYSPGNPKVSCI